MAKYIYFIIKSKFIKEELIGVDGNIIYTRDKNGIRKEIQKDLVIGFKTLKMTKKYIKIMRNKI